MSEGDRKDPLDSGFPFRDSEFELAANEEIVLEPAGQEAAGSDAEPSVPPADDLDLPPEPIESTYEASTAAPADDPLDLPLVDAPETASFEDDAFDSTADDTVVVPPAPDRARRFAFRAVDYALFAVVGMLLAGLAYINLQVMGEWGLVFLFILNVVGLVGVAIPAVLWLGRKTLNVYEVLLGVALTALLLGVCCLLVEVVRYGGDISAAGV